MIPQRIVILGGTGFVGRHLVARLAGDGHDVHVLSRNRSRHPLRGLPPGTRASSLDVYDGAALSRAFAGADAVVNLVGILNEAGDSGRGFRRVHVELTRTVIAACHEAGVRRLLQMSALNAGRGRSHYLASRGEAETVVKASALAWTIFQPSVIFGHGDGLFCRFAALLKIAPLLPLARADAKFAPVWVGDVVAAYARALVDPGTIGNVYELYGPQVFTLRQLVQMTARTLGRRRLVFGLPDPLGRMQALLGEFLPGQPFSRDNFRSLLTDAVGGIDGLHRLGIVPTPVGAVLPDLLGHALDHQTRLARYRTRS